MFTISVLNHHISFLLFVQQTISSRCITTPGASFVEHAGSRTLRRWRATDCIMPDLAVMFAFSLQPPQCYFSKGSGLQCTCKQLQCETQPCLFLYQTHPSVSWTLEEQNWRKSEHLYKGIDVVCATSLLKFVCCCKHHHFFILRVRNVCLFESSPPSLFW